MNSDVGADEGDGDPHEPLPRAALAPHEAQDHQHRAEGPDRLLERVAEVVRRQHRVPGAELGDRDDGDEHARDDARHVPLPQPGRFGQEQRPLSHEGHLGDGRHRASDEHDRERGVEEADPLHVGARKDRPERATEHEQRCKEQAAGGGTGAVPAPAARSRAGRRPGIRSQRAILKTDRARRNQIQATTPSDAFAIGI